MGIKRGLERETDRQFVVVSTICNSRNDKSSGSHPSSPAILRPVDRELRRVESDTGVKETVLVCGSALRTNLREWIDPRWGPLLTTFFFSFYET